MSERSCLASPPIRVEAGYDLSPAHKMAVVGALRWAWRQLVAIQHIALDTGIEESITAALEEQLGRVENGDRVAPGLLGFEHPGRGTKQSANDGRIEKQPDLIFRPPLSSYPHVTNATGWGYWVECKLIEARHGSRIVRSYIHEGIRRFAQGEYAPQMRSGMMLAYVRDTDAGTPAECLSPLLPIIPGAEADMCLSEHARGACTPPCPDIVLLHLWLYTECVAENSVVG